MEKLDFGKKGIMLLILELVWEACAKREFYNLKRALSIIEGL